MNYLLIYYFHTADQFHEDIYLKHSAAEFLILTGEIFYRSAEFKLYKHLINDITHIAIPSKGQMDYFIFLLSVSL